MVADFDDGVRGFLSTPSARRATQVGIMLIGEVLFLSTPSARRATYLLTVPPTSIKISIHALREEGDSISMPIWTMKFNFYPRPPRGGRPAAESHRNK